MAPGPSRDTGSRRLLDNSANGARVGLLWRCLSQPGRIVASRPGGINARTGVAPGEPNTGRVRPLYQTLSEVRIFAGKPREKPPKNLISDQVYGLSEGTPYLHRNS